MPVHQHADHERNGRPRQRHRGLGQPDHAGRHRHRLLGRRRAGQRGHRHGSRRRRLISAQNLKSHSSGKTGSVKSGSNVWGRIVAESRADRMCWRDSVSVREASASGSLHRFGQFFASKASCLRGMGSERVECRSSAFAVWLTQQGRPCTAACHAYPATPSWMPRRRILA